MKLKHICLFILVFSTLLGLGGCGGSGGAGLNGSIDVTAVATGGLVKATATYTNPTKSDVIGIEITFYAILDGVTYNLGTVNTNNSGIVVMPINVSPFNGSKDITVIAKTGELTDFDTITMAGRTETLKAPADVAVTAVAGSAAQLDFTIPPVSDFVTITDPFNRDINGHILDITYTATSSSNSPFTLNVPETTTTDSNGKAIFPGATGKITIPATAGSETITIFWTVTDPLTDQSATGTTMVKLTATAPAP